MIVTFPKQPVNDNQGVRFWICAACQQGTFVLIHDEPTGRTTIECAMCRTDVTDKIAPHLPIGIDLCPQ